MMPNRLPRRALPISSFLAASAITIATGLSNTHIAMRRLATLVLAVGLTVQGLIAVVVAEVPLSLEQLVLGSREIFVARILDVQVESGDRAVLGVFPVRLTSVEVLESLTPSPRTGTRYTIKEFASQTSPVKRDEIVLWYLTPPSSVGFVSPRLSGDFRRVIDDDIPLSSSRIMIQNLVGNQNLWENKPLWNNDSFRRDVASEYLMNFLRRRHPALGGPLADPTRHRDDILHVGEKAFESGPVPLDFLLAATHARLSALR